MLQQKISTPFQQFWLSKLLGFDYEIQYKQGKENLVADALSRVSNAEVLCLAISVFSSNIEQLISMSYSVDASILAILQSLKDNQNHWGNYTLVGNLIKKKNRILVGSDVQLKTKILNWHHNAPGGGHSGREGTLKRINPFFTRKG